MKKRKPRLSEELKTACLLMHAGVDEVGRGPLAGAVVTAAVILDPKKKIKGLMDSKQLTEADRNSLYETICEKAIAWAVGRAEVWEIDQYNILRASFLAMQRAVLALDVKPEIIFVDGNYAPDFGAPAHPVVKGDSLIPAISAASILAKVTRDQEMTVLDKQYPQYNFAQHKGYSTAEHLRLIQQHGPSPVHRQSFSPVKIAANQIELFGFDEMDELEVLKELEEI